MAVLVKRRQGRRESEVSPPTHQEDETVTHVSSTLRIEAPVARVWALLADITAFAQWSPGVQRCSLLTEHGTGLGAVRYIDRGGKNFLKEEVVGWEPYQSLTFRVIETNFPLRTSDIRTALEAHGDATIVTIEARYALKYGVLGVVLDALLVRNAYEQGLRASLAGLKTHAERLVRATA